MYTGRTLSLSFLNCKITFTGTALVPLSLFYSWFANRCTNKTESLGMEPTYRFGKMSNIFEMQSISNKNNETIFSSIMIVACALSNYSN
jgi:hypothetical protein